MVILTTMAKACSSKLSFEVVETVMDFGGGEVLQASR